MPNDFYSDPGVSEPSLRDQMDPLGTAGQNTFVDQQAPSASVKIGKTKVKTKMSIGKKIGYGVGGLIAAFLGLVIVLDPGTPQGNPSPKPPGGAPSQMMGANAAGGATVMGGAPAPVDGAAPASAMAGPEQPDVAVLVSSPSTPAASTPAPAPAAPAPAPAVTTPAPASAPAPAPMVQSVQAPPPVPVPAPAPAAAQLVLAKSSDKPQPDVKAGPTQAELASRVAMLERRLARYERAEAQQRARADRDSAPRPMARPARQSLTSSEKLVVTSQAAGDPRKPAVLASDAVRVIGVSSRQGVTSALVDFGGAKHRVSNGDSIPGLGPVQTVAVDAAGNPVVEINGVRYQ